MEISLKKGFFWYINRLRKMNSFELFHRLLEGFFYTRDALYYKKGWPDSDAFLNVEVLNNKLGESLILENEKLHKYFTSELNEQVLPFENTKLFKSITPSENFDIRAYWESQRFNQLTICSMENESSVLFILESWMESNPPLKGVNYISTMECAIRCINLYGALCVLNVKGQLDNKLLHLSNIFFAVNYRLIRNRISKFSSRGNHTLFEYAGLAVCALAGASKKKKYWVDKCINEFDYQTLDDGAGVEQSTAYHLFNIEVTWFIQKFLANGSHKTTKLDRAMLFCADFWSSGQLIRIGDSDSSVLFSRAFIENELTTLKERLKPKNIYHNSGVVSFKNKNLQGYFKYGSLGLAPLFGHGHYDFLSLILLDSTGDHITVDAQTYLYNTSNRNEYRSSSYHSMPICGLDDIKQISKFSWMHDNSGELVTAVGGWLTGCYQRNDGTVIRRSFKLSSNKLIVVDQLTEHKVDKELITQWLILNKKECFDFYLVDENKLVTKLLPSESKLDASFKYNKLEINKITKLELTSKSTEKIVTVLNLTSEISKKSFIDIARDICDVI